MSDSLKGVVKCDTPGCGWQSAPDVVVKEWAHSKCPLCNHLLMDDADRAMLASVNVLFDLGLAENATQEDGNVHIDTSKGKRNEQTPEGG